MISVSPPQAASIQAIEQENGFAKAERPRQAASIQVIEQENGSAKVDHPRVGTSVRLSPRLIHWRRRMDIVVALGSLGTAFLLSNLPHLPGDVESFLTLRLTIKNLLLTSGFLLWWIGLFTLAGLYDMRRVLKPAQEAFVVLRTTTLASAGALLFPALSQSGAFRFSAVALFWMFTTVGCLGARLVFQLPRLRQTLTSQGSSEILIVGTGPRALQVYRRLCRSRGRSCKLIGFIDDRPDLLPPTLVTKFLGSFAELEAILMNHPIDTVLVALPIKSQYANIQETLRLAEKVGVEAKYLSDVFNVKTARTQHYIESDLAVVSLKTAPDDHRLITKRAIDLVGASLALLIALPVMLVAATAIKCTSSGPIIFTQERYGLHKRRFTMYKFRSMVVNAEALQASVEERNEATGPIFKIKQDPRLTTVGGILRKTSVDELPQLFNVLVGHMSLVGPRPMSIRDVSRFDESWLMRRFSVRPGITGLWQVNGRSNTTFDRWIKLDLHYIDNWSLALDLGILAKTLPQVIKRSGAA